jgi:UDP-N-acetylglucosamine:LPS N-acetylglucosamine transferase
MQRAKKITHDYLPLPIFTQRMETRISDITENSRLLRLCVVSSVGGHLREVLQLLPPPGSCQLRFVINDAVQTMLPGPVDRIAHAERDLIVLWNGIEAVRYIKKYRPDVLLSTGAGPIVPFAIIGKLYGCKTIFVETFGAVETPSLTGQLVWRFADRFYYQWPQLGRFFPTGRYGGPVFTPGFLRISSRCAQDLAAEKARPLRVFVAVGTSGRGFDRLLQWIDELVKNSGLPGQILAQRGHSRYVPRYYESKPFFSSTELESHIATADVVICHAGAGLIGTCIIHNKRPILIPRLEKFGEAINNHQVSLAIALKNSGRAFLANKATEIPLLIKHVVTTIPTMLGHTEQTLKEFVWKDLCEFAKERGIDMR